MPTAPNMRCGRVQKAWGERSNDRPQQLHLYVGPQYVSTSPTQMLSHSVLQQNESCVQTFATQPAPSQFWFSFAPVVHALCAQFPSGGLLQHFPAVQVLVHFVPHMPQLLASVCVLVHLPTQSTSPWLQHVPARQSAPLQSVPHTPQFVLSFCRS